MSDRVFIQETDRIIIAAAASDNRARREGWQCIIAIMVMGICFLTVALVRLP